LRPASFAASSVERLLHISFTMVFIHGEANTSTFNQRCCGHWLLVISCLVAFSGCAGTEAPARTPEAEGKDSNQAGLSLAPAPPPALVEKHVEGARHCPNSVPLTRVSSARTKRGVVVLFSNDSEVHQSEVFQRARALVDQYNAVYGTDGERTSWAHVERSPLGTKVEFSIFTMPDLDRRIEPIPEGNEDELGGLRERVEAYVTTMQEAGSCPILQDLGAMPEPSDAAQGS
jgi:hypothetical protein